MERLAGGVPIPGRELWGWLRLLAGLVILGVLVADWAPVPFLPGCGRSPRRPLLAAAGIAVLTTVASAWRWCLVARGLGVGLRLRSAIAAYYQSQFLNSVLPGGILGDVDRALRHGGDVGNVGRGLRAVGWERTAGQVVQVALAMLVLVLLPSPVRTSMPVILVGVLFAAFVVLGWFRLRRRNSRSRWFRPLRAAAVDIREGLLARRAWPRIVLASTVVVAGHAATFLLAARTAGVSASTARLLPLALIVLLAMAVPTNIGGWGPREGVSAWLFAVAGFGADQGVATATVYGVLAFAASLPGVTVLVVGSVRRSRGERMGHEPRRASISLGQDSRPLPDLAARPQTSARG